jgi:hypothetical protein
MVCTWERRRKGQDWAEEKLTLHAGLTESQSSRRGLCSNHYWDKIAGSLQGHLNRSQALGAPGEEVLR